MGEAVQAVLPKEYTYLDNATKLRLKNSFAFLESAGSNAGEVEQLMVKLEGLTGTKGIIHKGVYNQLMGYSKKLDPQNINELVGVMRKFLLKPWKAMALFSSGYHGRNLMSNMMNGYLAGMSPTHYVTHFSEASADIAKFESKVMPKWKKVMSSGRKELKTIEGQGKLLREMMSPDEFKLWKEFEDMSRKGVIGNNQFSADHYDLMKQISEVGKKEGKIGKAAKAVADKTFGTSLKLGKLSDDASRIASYRWASRTKSGAKRVKKLGLESPESFSKYAFFDFNDLTPFEEKYMKSLFPFYTWARKNAEFHITNFINQSSRYTKFWHAVTNNQNMFLDSDDELSPYTKGSFQIPIWKSDGNITLMRLSPTFMDMQDLASNPLSRLSPVLKLPLEKMIGKKLFSGKSTTDNLFKMSQDEFIGSPSEIGKMLSGDIDSVDKSKLGLLGQRMFQATSAMNNMATMDIKSAADVMPSMFKQQNIEKAQMQNIYQRTSALEKYIRDLRRAGKYVPTYKEALGQPKVRYRNSKSKIESYGRKKR